MTKAATLQPGTAIVTVNQYTGKPKAYIVRAVSKSGRKITVDREDWATGKMDLTYRPTRGMFYNDYAGEAFRPV